MSTMHRLAAAILAPALVLSMAGCTDTEFDQRKNAQKDQNKTTEKAGDSLEQRNLRRRLSIEEKPDQIGYVYLLSFGKPVGYYVIKGKVSSSGSQLAPEQEIICAHTDSTECQAVDSSQDDGTYGNGDPGIFFFTAEGTFVHTSLDYVYSTHVLPVDVPELDGKGK